MDTTQQHLGPDARAILAGPHRVYIAIMCSIPIFRSEA